jgi:isoleucyl-tRNA synthetase
MELDGYDPADADVDDVDLAVVDEWVLSRLQSVKRETEAAWDDYEVDDALNALLAFVTEDVSRFYVKAIRERMWDEADSESKRAAYATVATLLDEVTRLLAPYAPYLTERMYQILDGEATTVHQLSQPDVEPSLRDPELESDVAVLRDVEEAAANARQRGGRKLRWPVTRVVVESDDEAVRASVERLGDLLADRVNSRTVAVTDSFGELVEVAEPRMAALGPAFGGESQAIMAAVEGATRDALETDDGFAVEVDGRTVDLDAEMLTFRSEAPEGVVAAPFEGGTVYVDTELTEDVEAEGYARDVIRRVQEMRKELDLEVDAEIRTAVDVDDDRVAGFVDRHRDLVAEETRTAEFVDLADDDFALVEEWTVEGVAVTIGLDPLD